MSVVVRNVERVERRVVEAFARFGVATVHEAQGRTGPHGALHAPHLSRRAHRRDRGHRQRAARRQLDASCRRRAMPGRATFSWSRPRPPATAAISATCSPPRSRPAACSASSSKPACATCVTLTEMGFPVWSRYISRAGNGQGHAGQRQSCRWCVPARLVHPGDLIVADDDGVCVVPARRRRRARQVARARAEGSSGARAPRRR